ncbi:MAG: hypothetical protein RR505_08190 [Raoultibacter sp.]
MAQAMAVFRVAWRSWRSKNYEEENYAHENKFKRLAAIVLSVTLALSSIAIGKFAEGSAVPDVPVEPALAENETLLDTDVSATEETEMQSITGEVY